MPHHGNEEEHSEGNEPRKPVIRDNRKVDPETGAARHPDSEAGGPAQGNAAPTDGDALSQAEEILNGVEVPAEESVAPGAAAEAQAAELRNDLLRLQAEYVNYRKRVERDRAVAGEMAVIGVLNSLLPVLDDVDAARQHGDLEGGPFAAIATKLENALKTYGLSASRKRVSNSTPPSTKHSSSSPARTSRLTPSARCCAPDTALANVCCGQPK